MHRLILGLLALLAVLAAALPAQATIPAGYVPRGPGNVYLALGDSLSVGAETAGNQDGVPGYPNRLAYMLRSVGEVRLENLGKSGETSATFISGGQLASAEAFIAAERAAGRRVGLVTLDIGGNDLLTLLPTAVAPYGKDANGEEVVAAYRANLTAILDRLLASLTVSGQRTGDLIVMDLYNPYPGLDLSAIGKGRLTDIWQPRLNAVTRELASARGNPVADVAETFLGHEIAYLFVQRPYASFFDPDLLTKYDFHPRPAGHAAIAGAFFGATGYRTAGYLPLTGRSAGS